MHSTDSTRRSGRATKGQHSRALEEAENVSTPPKRGKGSKAKKNEPTPPAEEEKDAIIRCVCGCVEEDKDDERAMICCDICFAWQHNECMGQPEFEEDIPDQYFCEQCRPENHVELLKKIKNHEKPWEERAKQRQLEEQSKRGRKKKGKKGGKRGRPSTAQIEEVKENGAMDTEPDTIQVEEPSQIVQTPSEPPEPESNKRKLVEEPEAEPKSPSQAVSHYDWRLNANTDSYIGACNQNP